VSGLVAFYDIWPANRVGLFQTPEPTLESEDVVAVIEPRGISEIDAGFTHHFFLSFSGYLVRNMMV